MLSEESPFQLSASWFALGVITPERLARLREEWARGEDQNPEHYRWQAFREFLAERRPLSPELTVALYALGDRDPDQAMGGSMMDAIVRLPECPDAVLDAALASGRRHLVRLAERRRAAG